MKNLGEILVALSILIKDAIKRINSHGIQKNLNYWPKKRLVGNVTDGGIRRTILKEISLE